MTLLFADSFDHYTAMPNVKGWVPSVLGPSGNATIGAFGRNGTNGLRCGDFRSGNSQPLPTQPTTLTVGAAVKVGQLPGASVILMALSDAGTPQVELRVDLSGRLIVTNNGTVRGQSAIATIVAGQYAYIELQAKIDNAAGTAVVKLNGNTLLNLAGIKTQTSANAWATHLTLCGVNLGIVNGPIDFDDLYVTDTNGVRNQGFLGDVRIQAVLPTGAGNYTQWDGLTGAATHWQAQNQNPPDDDATYVSDSLAVPGHLDSYAMGDVTPTSGTVAAVQVSAWARKDDAGVRTLATMVRSAAVDAVGGNVNLGNTYNYVTQVYETDPGGAAWTIASVNGAEAGVKAVA